ncbi:hypothetical protein [Sphingopyxis sp. EG6]|uniref:hypothetical protein n=1 Tax=Sphingopyxis sp. EG6 TaxID=1874061 RepID=UPI000DC61E32|nr:hypothetical protein [Sphingopyxis sp. EG6]BBB07899.1 hypothetical protein SPYCW_0915 [Sphingopyxis sp. EG6]
MRQRKRFYSLRFLLELAFIPISLIAAYALFVGVTFGFNLWRSEAPLVTVVWLMIVASPLWFYLLLKWSQTSTTRTAFLAAGVAIPASYFAFQLFA